jgi:hypothetical protein
VDSKNKVMAKTFLFLFIFAFSVSSCSKKNDVSKDSYEYFNTNLKPSMTYTNIIATFGNPDGDLGSGIHIYYYNLEDGTSIWIGYSDHIIYARHMSSNNVSAGLLHTII